MNQSEKHKREMVWLVENYHLRPSHFITLTHALDVKKETLEKNVNRFLMKASKYNKTDLAALAGMEVEANHQHAHLVLLGGKDIPSERLKERWKWGKVRIDKYEENDAEGVKLSSFYALNHPDTGWFADYCPNPKKCRKPGCVHRERFHERTP